ncbi:radical SAM protein, partial [Candidatus Woesearchaeota archaeon]|nr:radical SAM protein [Candidatus Woesearchaeota archaeon]
KKNPIYVGVGCMTGPQIIHALNIAKFVRSENPKIPIVWGGVHPSTLPEQTMQHPLVDIVLINEAEHSLVEMTTKIRNQQDLTGLKGIYFKKEGEIIKNPKVDVFANLSSFPIPAWHLILDDKDHYLIRIFSSKGCPYECTFCYNKLFHNRRWRVRTAKHVFEEIDYLVEHFGLKEIQIGDDVFILNKKIAIQIFDGLRERGLILKWCMTRADCIDEEVAQKMEGVVKEVSFGIESGSPRMLELIKKDTTIERIKESARILGKYDISFGSGFICGFPFETDEDLMLNVKFAKELHDINPNHRLMMGIFVPYPGSEMYNLMENKYGMKPPQTLEGWARSDQYGEIDPDLVPWLKDDMDFYKQYCKSFNNLFEMRNKRVRDIYKEGFWGKNKENMIVEEKDTQNLKANNQSESENSPIINDGAATEDCCSKGACTKSSYDSTSKHGPNFY